MKFDETPVAGTTIDDLDLAEVKAHINQATRVNRYQGDAASMEAFLLEERAAVQDGSTLIPTVAGLLMFGRRPQRHLPQATLTIAHYNGVTINSGDAIHLHEYTGNVRQQIDHVVTYLTESMRHGYVLTNGAQRQETPQYPRIALRELTVNAIAHRDYTIDAAAIRVTVLRNQIEWVSPGRLPPGVTIETILRHQYARNPTLLRLLYQASYVEKIGQGFDTVFSECDRLGLQPPIMQETELTFMVALVGHDVIGNTKIQQTLTQSQLQIVTVLMQHGRAMSTQEIYDAVSSAQSRSLRSVQNDLKILAEAKVVARSGQARASTYLLTQ